MKIDHIAIWTKDLELMKDFYVKYFNMKCNQKYVNEKKKFSSYFLSYEDGARIEMMHNPDIIDKSGKQNKMAGLIHFAISVGSVENVDVLTNKLRKDGFIIAGEPRTTGDGFYESVIMDPEGNLVEIIE